MCKPVVIPSPVTATYLRDTGESIANGEGPHDEAREITNESGRGKRSDLLVELLLQWNLSIKDLRNKDTSLIRTLPVGLSCIEKHREQPLK